MGKKLLESIAAPAAGAILGLASDEIAANRQFNQNKKMLGENVKASKELGRFNQELAYDMWERTNYSAQLEQMKKAGLSVGMMYGGSGAGGATTHGGSAPGASGQGTSLTNNLGMGLQAGLMSAQVENIRANTEKTKTETEKIGGVDTKEAEGRIAAMAADTKNKEVQFELLNLDKIMKKIQNNIANETQETIIKSVGEGFEKLKAETAQAVTDKRIKEETADDIIKQTKLQTEVQLVQIEAEKQGIKLSQEQTKAVTAGIERTFEEIENMIYYRNIDWQNLQLDERKTVVSEAMQKVSEKMSDFNTNTASQVKQWTDIVTGVADAAAKWTPGGRAASVKRP